MEGHLRDFKTNPFQTTAKIWEPGEAFHDMWVRVTLNQVYYANHGGGHGWSTSC
nr:DUF2889 domain-containing protein [Polynucleobacter necessarius]